MENIVKRRNDFPALKQKVHGWPLVYLDSGATSLKPQVVIDELTKYYSFETANVHRGIHYLSSFGTQRYEETRSAVKKFINANNECEIIFTKGTTDAINLVASSWSELFLKKGDQILISTMEHHSNIVPWQMIAEKKGAKIIEIPITDSGEIDIEAYKNLLNEKVKLVAMAHISNTLGTINPIKNFVQMAKQYNCHFLIDGAQSVPHMSIDVQDLGADFFTFSGHKMFGPNGVGVLWGKEELLEKMPPYQGGGAMIKEVSFEKTTYNDLPEKFEAGTPAIAEVICLKTAIDYLFEIDLNQVHHYEEKLLQYAEEKLREIEGLKIIGNATEKASVISFVMDGAHPHDIGMLVDQQGVAIRTGHHCTMPLMKRFQVPATARASLAFYNNFEDIDQLVFALNKAKDLL